MSDSSTHSKSEYVIDTVDPSGKLIYLTSITWRKITEGHFYMLGELHKVKDAVENPDEIKIDKDRISTHNYYKAHGDVAFPPQHKFIRVCVDIDMGKIKSAHMTHSVHRKDKKYWP